jgi:hypothetical protein
MGNIKLELFIQELKAEGGNIGDPYEVTLTGESVTSLKDDVNETITTMIKTYSLGAAYYEVWYCLTKGGVYLDCEDAMIVVAEDGNFTWIAETIAI